MSAAFDVALATCAELPEPDPDAEALARALADAGLSARLLAWDDPAAPFADARVTVLRSTWNYLHHVDDFLAWAARVGDRLLNPLAIVRWNHHKAYLHDLVVLGVPVVPTVLAVRGDGRTLPQHLAAKGWSRAVAKPAVSAGSFETRVVDRGGAHDAWFREAVGARDMLVQPYVASVDTHGERSLVWIDGEVTHAIRKSPRFAGGGERVSEAAVPVGDDERAFADRAVDAARRRTGARPLYARVDVVRDEGGALRVMELELIEPSLFFAQGPEGLGRFVRALATIVR